MSVVVEEDLWDSLSSLPPKLAMVELILKVDMVVAGGAWLSCV